MASGLKYAITLSAACVLVALAILRWGPRREWELQNAAEMSLEMAVEAAQASSVVDSLQRQYAGYVIGDTVAALMLSHKAGVIIEQPASTLEPPALTRALIDRQLAGIEPMRARVGVFFFEPKLGRYPGAPWMDANRSWHFITGVDSAGPYCAVALPLQERSPRKNIVSTGLRYTATPSWNESNVAGPCRFWARYGAPGAGVERWLRQGGYHFASAPVGRPRAVDPEPELFGINMHFEAPVGTPGVACRAGYVEECGVALNTVSPSRAAGSAAYVTGASWGNDQFGYDEQKMFAHVEQAFGPEKFAKFWQSTDPMPVAFEKAFGRNVNEWAMEWARSTYGVAGRGPRLSGFSVVLTVLTLLVLGVSATVIARYREVR